MDWVLAEFSVTVTCLSLYPYDTMIARTMMQSGRKKRHYNGVYDVFSKILKEEGVSGFYKGLLPSLFRAWASSIILVIYSKISDNIDY
jgi:solute carrier family 25 (adenine nucleotide translocator) protein 4/5/6/31